MDKRRLILAGGGDAQDSRPLDDIFAGWTGSGKMLYIPLAIPEGEGAYATAFRWVCSVFHPLGVNDITLWTRLKDQDLEHIDEFASIYLGGGNTYRLLNLMRSSEFDLALLDFVEHGGAVYGGSAGAIVLGRDILSCAHIDENEIGLTETAGLDLLNRYTIWCHYQPEDDQRIAAYMEQYGFPVLGLSERAGIKVEGERIAAAGYDPVIQFIGADRFEIRAREAIL